MTDIVNKCEEAYALIQRCQNNDSALVEEKFKIERLVTEVSALLGKCELEPAETDNLTYYFEYDIAYTLENTIGEIRLLKPGQKGLFVFSVVTKCSHSCAEWHESRFALCFSSYFFGVMIVQFWFIALSYTLPDTGLPASLTSCSRQ